jgi:hypothetical protein
LDSAQKVSMMSLVWLVTGSEKSPPGGETAPIRVTEPEPASKVSTRPARS